MDDVDDVDDRHMQIGEVAARTELSLRTIRHYEETGLVIPSARSQGGFRLYTETDVARLMVIRRMKPLGFTLEQMRDLLDATDRLDGDARLDPAERAALLERVRTYQQAAAEQVEKLRTQLSRAEDFATTLTARLNRTAPPAGTQPDDDTPDRRRPRRARRAVRVAVPPRPAGFAPTHFFGARQIFSTRTECPATSRLMSSVSEVKTVASAPCAASCPATAARIASMAYLCPCRPAVFSMSRAMAMTRSSVCTTRMRDSVQFHTDCLGASRGSHASNVVSAEVTIGMSSRGAVLISAVISLSP